jgi:NADPH:quinone reductase-like Zn-dependent oxidoreductase
VAINHTDWKHIDYKMSKEGNRVGCDIAGQVVAVGSEVTPVHLIITQIMALSLNTLLSRPTRRSRSPLNSGTTAGS